MDLKFLHGCITLACVLSVIMLLEFTNADPLMEKAITRFRRGANCKTDCSKTKRRPVCGTDGETYRSKCELNRVKNCDGRNVEVAKKGKCSKSSGSTSSKCLYERDEAQAIARRPTVGIFIPDCKGDGTFAEVQCHAATGYCWCVDKGGKPILGTSTDGKKPKCKGLARTRRKKHSRKKEKKGGKSNGVSGFAGGCVQKARATFNRNLIKEFTEEYIRNVGPLKPISKQDSIINTPDKQVVEWKFTQLDRDHDGTLKRKEVRSFKKLVKRMVKPRSCAKSFVKFCDLDQDKRIRKNEWSLCLGVDLNNEKSTTAPRGSTNGEGPFHTDLFSGLLQNRLQANRKRPTLISEHISRPSESAPTIDTLEDDTKSCAEERAAAMSSMEYLMATTFIPTCTHDGLWRKIQCHNETEYCWCVKQETGEPILGTSTHKSTPNCDVKEDREMKGCMMANKRDFLGELMLIMKKEMMNATGLSQIVSPSSKISVEEHVARRKLRLMDVNGNGILERGELKAFKKDIRKHKSLRKKSLRKCKRNFLRFCDESGDNKITTEEWITCLGIYHNYYSVNRRGPNPINKYLSPA